MTLRHLFRCHPRCDAAELSTIPIPDYRAAQMNGHVERALRGLRRRGQEASAIRVSDPELLAALDRWWLMNEGTGGAQMADRRADVGRAAGPTAPASRASGPPSGSPATTGHAPAEPPIIVVTDSSTLAWSMVVQSPRRDTFRYARMPMGAISPSIVTLRELNAALHGIAMRARGGHANDGGAPGGGPTADSGTPGTSGQC